MKQFVSDLLHGFCVASAVMIVYGAVLMLFAALFGYETGVLGW